MPIHKHDCDKCRFLFTADNRDYYHCGGTLIIRDGDEPQDNRTVSIEIIYRMYPHRFADRIMDAVRGIG